MIVHVEIEPIHLFYANILYQIAIAISGGGPMNHDHVVREHLLYLLRGGGAHMSFDDAVADFPLELINVTPPNVPYTPWHLVEHLRITQWDILEFVRNPHHVSPTWPDGYWPARDAQADAAAWNNSLAAFKADLQAMQALVSDPDTDLYVPLPHGEGQTVLREALLVADHNAYHLGQLVLLRRALGAWPEGG